MPTATVKFLGAPLAETVEVDVTNHSLRIDGRQMDAGLIPFDTPVSGTVYGTLLNFQGAVRKLSAAMNEPPYKAPPQAPILYIKPQNTFSAAKAAIPLPANVPALEMGGALGVVIGRRATRVRVEDALEYVAGYTIVNDVSIPHDSFYRPAIAAKSRDGFCPIGPWIIERNAIANPNQLTQRIYINGALRQENTTANLVRSVERLLAEVTEFMTLDAGDVLLVGVPEHAPLAHAGDHVRIEIDGLGYLENTVVLEREWTPEAVR